MADKYRKLVTGDRWKVHAGLHNDLVDLAKAEEVRRSHSQKSISTSDNDPLRILNTSDETFIRYGIVGTGAPITTPSAYLPEFEDKKGFESIEPAADQPFAILQEFIKPDTIGTALGFGISQVRIAMAAADDGYALPIAADYDKLASSATPAAAVIRWRDTLPAAAREETVTLRTGVIAPDDADGSDGDYYEDTVTELWYGPKAAGAWGSGHAFGTGTVWAVVLFGSSCDCPGGEGGGCPDPDAIGGMAWFNDLTGSGAFGGPGAALLSSTLVWTVPDCVTEVLVEIFGLGGAGVWSGGVGPGIGGAGGGSYAAKTVTVVPGDIYRLRFDAGAGYPASVQNIYFTTFSDATPIVLAESGQNAGGLTGSTTGGSGGLAVNCVGDVAFDGGNGGAGNPAGSGITLYGGGGGAGAGPAGPGGAGQNFLVLPATASGGTGYSRGGGAGATCGDGENPGGGGGNPSFGMSTTHEGGAGLVRITWGPGVTALNGETGSVTLKGAAGSGIKVTTGSGTNKVLSVGIELSSTRTLGFGIASY